MADAMTWGEWLQLIDNHDLAYSMSENAKRYKDGSKQFMAILEAAQLFPHGDVRRAWNAMCDRKSGHHGAEFYWSG